LWNANNGWEGEQQEIVLIYPALGASNEANT